MLQKVKIPRSRLLLSYSFYDQNSCSSSLLVWVCFLSLGIYSLSLPEPCSLHYLWSLFHFDVLANTVIGVIKSFVGVVRHLSVVVS